MNHMPRLFVDIETTHLDPRIGEIIEICIIREFPNGRQDMYHRKIHPLRIEDADPKALEINKYTPYEWKNAVLWEDIASEVHSLLRHGVFISHNVGFDWSWVDHHVKESTGRLITWYKFDTITLAWEHLPPIGVSMKSIRSFFGWSHWGQHTAPVDCHDCRRIYHLLIRSSYVQRTWWRFKHWLIEQTS